MKKLIKTMLLVCAAIGTILFILNCLDSDCAKESR